MRSQERMWPPRTPPKRRAAARGGAASRRRAGREPPAIRVSIVRRGPSAHSCQLKPRQTTTVWMPMASVPAQWARLHFVENVIAQRASGFELDMGDCHHSRSKLNLQRCKTLRRCSGDCLTTTPWALRNRKASTLAPRNPLRLASPSSSCR